MIFGEGIVLPVIVPAVRNISSDQYHIILIEQFNTVSNNTCPVTFNIQNELILRMKVPHASSIINICGSESTTVIILYFLKFSYHAIICQYRSDSIKTVSYTHLRAHETVLALV